MKVPLSIGWLSENEMLGKALHVRNMILCEITKDQKGITVWTGVKEPNKMSLVWADNLLFTLEELKRLGFTWV